MAKVTYRNASLISVEVPSLGASFAYIAFPKSTSDVGRGSLVDLRALTINDGVSLKALLTDSLFLVELLTGSLDLTANSVLIKVVSFGTLEAGVAAPNFTSKVVIKLYEESSVLELLLA